MKIRRNDSTEGPNFSGVYTASIDVEFTRYAFGRPEWWLSAMEFHSKSKAEAERIRDLVMARLEN